MASTRAARAILANETSRAGCLGTTALHVAAQKAAMGKVRNGWGIRLLLRVSPRDKTFRAYHIVFLKNALAAITPIVRVSKLSVAQLAVIVC